jgi:hypothetical protein
VVKCCVWRDKDGECLEYGSASATALWCRDMTVPDTYQVGDTVIFGPPEAGYEMCNAQEPANGTCCDLGISEGDLAEECQTLANLP